MLSRRNCAVLTAPPQESSWRRLERSEVFVTYDARSGTLRSCTFHHAIADEKVSDACSKPSLVGKRDRRHSAVLVPWSRATQRRRHNRAQGRCRCVMTDPRQGHEGREETVSRRLMGLMTILCASSASGGTLKITVRTCCLAVVASLLLFVLRRAPTNQKSAENGSAGASRDPRCSARQKKVFPARVSSFSLRTRGLLRVRETLFH